MEVVGFSKGSDNYSGTWGVWVAYTFDTRQSFNLYSFASDDEFGHQEKLGISYTYEFK